jgi:hypothetical protein
VTAFVEGQAAAARARGQGRHIPGTRKQALAAELGAAQALVDFPAAVKCGDALCGMDAWQRAAYQTRTAQLRELNAAAGLPAGRWVRLASDAEITALRDQASAVGNTAVARACRHALDGDQGCRQMLVDLVLLPAAEVLAATPERSL